MIDFRYHLISLIAVILALALGILAGSGFLGGPLLEQLQSQVTDFRGEARDLRAEISEQDVKLDQSEEFARAAEPFMTRGQLAGDEIVLFQFEGTDGRLIDGVTQALADAGAQIITQITLTKKLSLGSAPVQDELSLITGSLTGNESELLEETATMLGERAAASAAEGTPAASPNSSAAQRFDSFLGDLETSEFVGADVPVDARSVPAGAEFLVIGGSGDRPPFEMLGFVSALAEALTERGAPTIFVESSLSEWGVVQAVRADIEARARTATVDNGETTIGRIAVVLGLDEAGEGNFGHYGTRTDTTVIPVPNQTG
jgi:hypothetical protein